MNSSSIAKPKARILIVDDDRVFRNTLYAELVGSGYEVVQAADDAELRAALAENDTDVILLDLRFPSGDGISMLEHIKGTTAAEVIVLTGHGTVQTAIRAMKIGAADFLTKPCDLDELELTIERTLETRNLKIRTEILERGLARAEIELVGRSPRFMKMMSEVERAAQSRSPVLVTGESGTGKELVARRLHQLSPAHNKPFIVVDCASLSDELMHNELFGHEKGAYTGATERKHGLFEVADGGSLCLDEVGEVSPRVQAKLLRVLDSGTFRRAGATREIHVDVRVISSTNRRLDDMFASQAFREDLYFRISPLHISVPPLRERAEDIPLLATHFFTRAVRRLTDPPALESSAIDALVAYPWPGNVRELLGVIERLVVFRSSGQISRADVEPLLSGRERATAASYGTLPLAEVERRHIENVLRECGNHRAAAARMLGISQRTLYRKLGGQ